MMSILAITLRLFLIVDWVEFGVHNVAVDASIEERSWAVSAAEIDVVNKKNGRYHCLYAIWQH
jgi:hypothetical protein